MSNLSDAVAEPLSEVREFDVRYAACWQKRWFDICGASLGILFLSPIFLILIAVLKFSEGAVFFRHQRLGRLGVTFGCLKFRTMLADGDQVLAEHLANNPDARQEWLTTRKLRDDPRVTPLGKVLRKLSLDELPQLVNILKGDMSIVGPRPIVYDELRYYGDSADCYLGSRPGLTGLWQVSGRSDVCYDNRVGFDRHYAENQSFSMDIKIIVKTVPAVFLSKGSY